MAEMIISQAGLAIDLQHTGNKICAQFSIMPPRNAFPPVPEAICEALAEVDNYV